MRFMLIERAGPDAHGAVAMPEAERARFGRALVRAGVLLAAERLAPCEGAEVAGFWLLEVKSKEEAHEWARRAGGGARIEIRQVVQPEETVHAIPYPDQG